MEVTIFKSRYSNNIIYYSQKRKKFPIFEYHYSRSRLFLFFFFSTRVVTGSPPPLHEQWLFFPLPSPSSARDYESLHNILSTALTDRRKTKGRERLDFVYLFFTSLYTLRLFRKKKWFRGEGIDGMEIMNGRFYPSSSFNFIFII